MNTTTQTFREVKLGYNVNTFCPTCQKKLARVITVSQTINPFNRNAAGHVKTENEIREENKVKLKLRVEKAEAEGCVCRKCERAERSR